MKKAIYRLLILAILGGAGYAGYRYYKQMPARQEAGDGQPDGILLADNNFINLRDERLDPAFHGGSGNVGRRLGIVEGEKRPRVE